MSKITFKPAYILRKQLLKAEQGFAIVTALFILVVLAALGGFIISVSTSQHMGSAMDVQGVRAYEAARSGVEWGLYQAHASANYNFSYGTGVPAVGAASPDLRACPTSPSSFNPAAATLSGFAVTVTCTRTTDASSGPASYAVSAVACNQPVTGWTATTAACPNTSNPSANYVERRVDVAF